MSRWKLKKQISELNEKLKKEYDRGYNDGLDEMKEVTSYCCCRCVLRDICKFWDCNKKVCHIHIESTLLGYERNEEDEWV